MHLRPAARRGLNICNKNTRLTVGYFYSMHKNGALRSNFMGRRVPRERAGILRYTRIVQLRSNFTGRWVPKEHTDILAWEGGW